MYLLYMIFLLNIESAEYYISLFDVSAKLFLKESFKYVIHVKTQIKNK